MTRLRGLHLTGGEVTNIVGDGHVVDHDAAANPSPQGKTYALSGGGTLEPAA